MIIFSLFPRLLTGKASLHMVFTESAEEDKAQASVWSLTGSGGPGKPDVPGWELASRPKMLGFLGRRIPTQPRDSHGNGILLPFPGPPPENSLWVLGLVLCPIFTLMSFAQKGKAATLSTRVGKH